MLRVVPLTVAGLVASLSLAAAPSRAHPVRWDDLAVPIQRRLIAAGLDAVSFPVFRSENERRTQERVREGDLDALVYYALQSNTFTADPAIEPALSAKAFVDEMDEELRRRFLSGQALPANLMPMAARRRLLALTAALRTPRPGSRLAYFRDVVRAESSRRAQSETVLVLDHYAPAMRFLYEKEFVAPGRADRTDAVAALYHARALSTDTATEAGYLVSLGLRTLQALEPSRRIRRVLIVGPGLDLAPRTGLLEAGPPESYQPYAVVDALVGLELSRLDDLVVLGADVNPRVVAHLQAARARDILVALVSGVGNSATVTLQDDYRRYFGALGASIADMTPEPKLSSQYEGHLRKSFRVRRTASRAIDGVRLDIATERLDGDPFDLVIATNVFPYLDDTQLTLALANVAAMLAPGGVFLHNEARPLVGEVTTDLKLPLSSARTAPIATVRGSATPLYDSVFVHVKEK